MKEAKILTYIFGLSLIIACCLLLFVPVLRHGICYDIVMGIITGLIVSLMGVVAQYFIQKGRIKNDIFNCYFDLYKKIYNVEKMHTFLGYNWISLYKKMENFSVEYSKLVSEYSGFINNKYSLLYKKLNPSIKVDYDIYNIKNIAKLLFPFNHKKFKEIIVPFKLELENAMRVLNNKKFNKEFKEYKRISNLILGKK